jgi:hypothetical protein
LVSFLAHTSVAAYPGKGRLDHEASQLFVKNKVEDSNSCSLPSIGEQSELIAANALLRQRLTILHRQIKRPVYKKTDRLLLVLLARMVRTLKQTLYLVQEDDTAAKAS